MHLVKTLKETENVKGVDIPIKVHDRRTVRVDIVAETIYTNTYIKCVARNSRALNDIAFGRSNYGAKSILDHAECYAAIVQNNECSFQVTKV